MRRGNFGGTVCATRTAVYTPLSEIDEEVDGSRVIKPDAPVRGSWR